MLELVARHGAFDLTIAAEGDLDVDQHHTVEDLGIALGEAVVAGARHRRGINRAGYFVMPMDETLAVAAIDLGGRAARRRRSAAEGARASAICRRSWCTTSSKASRSGARANVHVKVLYGRSSHHQIEAVFKAFARALRVACSKDRQLATDAAEHEGAAVDRDAIALIDYGAGNLTSVRKALRRGRRRAVHAVATRRTSAARPASSCPGVGHFGATRALDARWRDGDPATRSRRRRPLLGICLGMQWLFEGSDEAPDVPGLGAAAGTLRAAAAADASRCRTSAGTRSTSRASRGCSTASRRRAGLLHALATPRR